MTERFRHRIIESSEYFKLVAIENIKEGDTCSYDNIFSDPTIWRWDPELTKPCGIALHDIKKGDIVDFHPSKDTKDISVEEWKGMI